MDDVPLNHERKFWSQPIKHMGIGGGLTALVFALTPYFQTKNDAAKETVKVVSIDGKLDALTSVVEKGFARLETMQFAHASDETSKHERMTDEFRSELKSEKDDRIRELALIESLFKIKHSKTN